MDKDKQILIPTTNYLKQLNDVTTILSSRHINSITVQSALKSDQLSKIRKHEPVLSLAIVAKLIQEVSKFKSNNFTYDDAALYAEMILSNFWHYRIDEIILCFSNGVNGKYGKVFGKLEYSTLTEWLTIYGESKDGAIESDRIQTNSKHSPVGTDERIGDTTTLRDIYGTTKGK